MTMTVDMTDADLLRYLIETSDVPSAATVAYSAGYFESTLLSLMARFPEVRREIEDRVAFRRREVGA